MSLLSLPNESLELILITCAADEHIESVAAVAATSRQLFSIIYNSPDSHLWRSLFLTLFDDPREQKHTPQPEVNWRKQLQDRAWTRWFITHHAKPVVMLRRRSLRTVYGVQHVPYAEHAAHLRALAAVVSVIRTAIPDSRSVDDRQRTVVQADRPNQPVNLVQLHRQAPQWPPSEPADERRSLNIAWLRNTLINGLPTALTMRLSSGHVEHSLSHGSREGLALGPVASHLGFLPAPIVDDDVFLSPETTLLDMSEYAQYHRALWHARERAFDMEYPSQRRNWGPYLPVHSDRPSPDSVADDDYVEEDEDGSDPDWVPHDDPSRAVNVPSPDQLLPDWSWLAAARVVAEYTLRAHTASEGYQRLLTWDNVREGAWLRPMASNPCLDTSNPENAEGSAIGGSDWAGAEGTWRRLVCWLGYDDLVRYNEFGGYDDPDLEEAWIIVPLSLRITGYSPSPVAKYSDRPTIHVEGDMGGGYWQGNVDISEEDVRRVHGTVSMLADGSVRWSITSMDEDNADDQWASEAIQLGGLGSAMGALGMWTGVNHEEDDPLGVIWQWRVA